MKFKAGAIVGIEMTDGLPFEKIKTDVQNWVDIGIADRVEVRNMAGQLAHYYSRLMRAAQS